MVAYMVADMEMDMVVDMELDKVADMVTGHGCWLIGPKLFRPTCVFSIAFLVYYLSVDI